MKKKNLLVTGGLGHVGSKMIRDYSKRDDLETIRIFDSLITQRYCSLFNLPREPRYEFVEGDITNEETLRRSLNGIDTVIHLAGITDAPSTINSPEETHRINFHAVKTILATSIDAGVERFLFPSSTSVYGETNGLVNETFSDFKPCTPYAEAKLAAEKVVQEAGKSGKIHTNVLRMGTIFGVSPGMRFHTAVNKFIYLACLNQPVTIWENAIDQKRPYLALGDCIRAFEFIEKNGVSGELYNVLTDNFTPREVTDRIKHYLPDLEIKITKSPIINQKSYEVSAEKLRRLGFSPKESLLDEVGKYIESLGILYHGRME